MKKQRTATGLLDADGDPSSGSGTIPQHAEALRHEIARLLSHLSTTIAMRPEQAVATTEVQQMAEQSQISPLEFRSSTHEGRSRGLINSASLSGESRDAQQKVCEALSGIMRVETSQE
jgi:hypothetical protein